MRSNPISRAILVGPSVDLSHARQATWMKACFRKLGVRPSDFLVGVDGGIRFLAGKRPALVIGDWDSAKVAEARRFERAGSRLVTLSPRKNESDLAAALGEVAKHPFKELALYGFTGGRADHHLSNLLEITQFAATQGSKTRFQKIAAFGPDAEYHFLTHSQPAFRYRLPRGRLISIFALKGRARGVSMKGFEYNLHAEDLEPGSRGLSNRARTREVEIRLTRGSLLVVIPRG